MTMPALVIGLPSSADTTSKGTAFIPAISPLSRTKLLTRVLRVFSASPSCEAPPFTMTRACGEARSTRSAHISRRGFVIFPWNKSTPEASGSHCGSAASTEAKLSRAAPAGAEAQESRTKNERSVAAKAASTKVAETLVEAALVEE
jgi:hypothetical protein